MKNKESKPKIWLKLKYGQILLKNDIKSSISIGRKPKFAFFEVGAVFPTLNYPRNIETEVPDIAQYLALEWPDARTDGRTLLKLRSRITLEGSEIEKKFIGQTPPNSTTARLLSLFPAL